MWPCKMHSSELQISLQPWIDFELDYWISYSVMYLQSGRVLAKVFRECTSLHGDNSGRKWPLAKCTKPCCILRHIWLCSWFKLPGPTQSDLEVLKSSQVCIQWIWDVWAHCHTMRSHILWSLKLGLAWILWSHCHQISFRMRFAYNPAELIQPKEQCNSLLQDEWEDKLGNWCELKPCAYMVVLLGLL
jgi:hypothetical protein